MDGLAVTVDTISDNINWYLKDNGFSLSQDEVDKLIDTYIRFFVISADPKTIEMIYRSMLRWKK
jgi:glycogen synthase